ncbi:hypothetical protein HMPREF3193_00749 [Bifidobacterium breve]|nr:hypothetical protein HMPREF3193_00749 [Bifidobacterium breve]
MSEMRKWARISGKPIVHAIVVRSIRHVRNRRVVPVKTRNLFVFRTEPSRVGLVVLTGDNR